MAREFELFFSNRNIHQSKVDELKVALRKLLPNFPFEDVASQIPMQDDWKDHARPLIESCVAVICVIGPSTSESEPVDWELRQAAKTGKPLFVTTLSDGLELPKFCKEQPIPIFRWNTVELAGAIGEAAVPRALFSKDKEEYGEQYLSLLWNQYNLMVQSSEALSSRRQNVNSLYISAGAALLAGMGVLISNVKSISVLWASSGALSLALLGIALSFNWRRTLESYGTLNKAKFQVISAMEDLMPAQLFDAEWKVLEARRYRSTTKMDGQTANFILALFSVIAAVGILLVGLECFS